MFEAWNGNVKTLSDSFSCMCHMRRYQSPKNSPTISGNILKFWFYLIFSSSVSVIVGYGVWNVKPFPIPFLLCASLGRFPFRNSEGNDLSKICHLEQMSTLEDFPYSYKFPTISGNILKFLFYLMFGPSVFLFIVYGVRNKECKNLI